MAPPVPVRLGRYSLERRIGTGGMAELYVARYAAAGGRQRSCVVKRLLPELAADPDRVTRFLDEARVNLLLDHPGIVPVVDVGIQGDEVFLAMEHVDGPDLRWVIDASRRAGRRLPPEVALQVVGELLDALAHAHGIHGPDGRSLGLVHRDISPENVLIDRTGRVWLTDFGAADSTVSLSTPLVGTAVGKLTYMAPEVLARGDAGQSADLFAAGLVLFELLALRPLLGATSAEQAWAFWEGFDATKVVPAWLPLAQGGAALIKALERDPARRHPSAASFHADVLEALLRRGRRAGRTELASLLGSLQGTPGADGRLATSPVELPPDGRRGGGVPAAGRGPDYHALIDGVGHGPLDEATARARVESADRGDALVSIAEREWSPAGDRWPRAAGAPPEVRPAMCAGVEVGPRLLALAGGGPTRVTLWRGRDAVSLELVGARIRRAVHHVPGAGGADTFVPWDVAPARAGAPSTAPSVPMGLEPTMMAALIRRRLRPFVALPMGWDSLFLRALPLADVDAGEDWGAPLERVVVDAARMAGDDVGAALRIEERAREGLLAREPGLEPALEGLLDEEREVLEAVRAGADLGGLLRRARGDEPPVFRALFVLLQLQCIALGSRASRPR